MTARRNLPIVVGGCHRSGTSLVRRLLNGHPRIDCPPEVPFFRDFYGEYRDDPLAHLRFSTTVRSMVAEDVALEALGRAFVDLHVAGARSRGKQRWADKTPENAIHLEDWQHLLGDDWLYLHVVRNPLDTLASMDEVRFPLTLPADLEPRIAFYLQYTSAGLDWIDGHPDRSRLIVYDQLVTAPQQELAALMAWLDEDFDPLQLEVGAERHGRGLEDPRIGNSRSIHEGSVGRWRTRLYAADAHSIWSETGPLWQRVDPSLACCAGP